ncbi:putative gene 29776 [Cricetulus griseus]
MPDAHLRGYSLWPEHGLPQLIQPDGPGVQNTDFLLYVRVAHTSKCHKEPSVIAYAACCQLDSEDRPLAGTIVYCAQHLTSPSLSHGDIVTPARENCSTRKHVTRRDEWGQLLLTTPTVSHSLAKHLGVPGTVLGVPLEEEVCVEWVGDCTTVSDPSVISLLSLPHSGLGCHYLHLDKGSCSSDPVLEGCRIYKPLASGSECWKEENGLLTRAENPHGEIYHLHSRCFLANLTSQALSKGKIPGYYGLLYCPQGRLCLSNKGTSAVTSPQMSFSTQDLLFQLSLGLTGTPGHSLGKEEREELAEVVLQALVTRGGTSRCYFHSPSITTNLMFTVSMWKSPGCQGPSVATLYQNLTLSFQEKPLQVHHGKAIFTTEYSK